MRGIIVLLLFLSLFAMTAEAKELCTDCTVTWEPINGSVHKAIRSSSISSGVVGMGWLSMAHWRQANILWDQLEGCKKTPELKAKYENLSRAVAFRPFGMYAKFRWELNDLLQEVNSCNFIEVKI